MAASSQRGGTNRGGRYGTLPRRPGLISQVLRFGAHQIGVPYQWGGTSRSTGFDCSGLVWAAYTRAGYQGIGRTTYDQIKQGIAVGKGQLQPGDIVFPEPGHEGLYVGNGMILEAPHTGANVKLIPLNQFGFWQARRLLRGGGGVIPPPKLGGVSQTGLPVPHPDIVAQQQHMAQLVKQQTAQFSNALLAQQQSFKQQMARQQQQQLSSQLLQQAQARVGAAQTAQAGVGQGLLPGAPPDTQQTLGVEGKTSLDALHAKLSKGAGFAA